MSFKSYLQVESPSSTHSSLAVLYRHILDIIKKKTKASVRKVIKLLDFRYSELRELKFFQGKLILVYTECIQSNKNSLVGGSTGQEQAL